MMIDIDGIVATVTPSSTFDSLSGFGDPDPTDLDRLAASLHDLALCSGKPGANEADEHLPLEAVAEHEQLLVSAVPTAGEQL